MKPSPPARWRRTVCIRFSASDFEMERYKGRLNTWEDYGKFMYTLNQGRDQLPEAVKQTVHQLTDGMTSPAEDQIAVSLPAAEHPPMSAYSLVLAAGKHLMLLMWPAKVTAIVRRSPTMYSLLKEAGIPSYCALVHAGQGKN